MCKENLQVAGPLTPVLGLAVSRVWNVTCGRGHLRFICELRKIHPNPEVGWQNFWEGWGFILASQLQSDSEVEVIYIHLITMAILVYEKSSSTSSEENSSSKSSEDSASGSAVASPIGSQSASVATLSASWGS